MRMLQAIYDMIVKIGIVTDFSLNRNPEFTMRRAAMLTESDSARRLFRSRETCRRRMWSRGRGPDQPGSGYFRAIRGTSADMSGGWSLEGAPWGQKASRCQRPHGLPAT